jgi:hypothetical protein
MAPVAKTLFGRSVRISGLSIFHLVMTREAKGWRYILEQGVVHL